MTHPRPSTLSSRMALPAMLALAATLALAGCNQRHDTAAMESAPAPAPMAGGAGMKQGRAATVQAEDAAAAAPETSVQDEMAQRFLAVRQEPDLLHPSRWGRPSLRGLFTRGKRVPAPAG